LRNIKLTIEYDGTNYHGWQIQDNAITVQQVIQEAVSKLTGEKCELIGSSRTDVGVHALGMAANFKTCSTIPGDRFSFALNNLLPNDIVIKKSEEVSPDFHARFSCTGKKYRYLIYNSPTPSALLRNRAFYVPKALCVEDMRKAAEYFLGEHDFSAFAAAGGSTKTFVRKISSVSLDKRDDCIQFEITGNGFLYNMVRIIAGTLVDVGMGKISPDAIPKIIESGNRKMAGRTAPAHGLYLVEVYY